MQADVERLRYILTAQRDQYLPLRVIKERLPPAGADGRAGRARRQGRVRRRAASPPAAPEPLRRELPRPGSTTSS